MEFDIVRMFIDVTRDHTIFHGWDIKWKKDDQLEVKQFANKRDVHERFFGCSN